MKILKISLLSLVLGTWPFEARAAERSLHTIATGNGHGFQIFDTKSERIVGFLDHPYRFLRPNEDIRDDGVERRNLLEDFAFGMNSKHGHVWVDRLSPSETEYLKETNIIRSVSRVDGKPVERIFFSPFGLEKNALVAMFRAAATTKRADVSTAFARLQFHLGANPQPEELHKSPMRVVKLPGETVSRRKGRVPMWIERSRGLGAMVYIPLQEKPFLTCQIQGGTKPKVVDEFGHPNCKGADITLELAAPADREGWFGVLVVYVEDVKKLESEIKSIETWIAGRSNQTILNDSLAEFEAWRKRPEVKFSSASEEKLWRQSETVLRMSQVREANRFEKGKLHASHGMVLASLAPGHWTIGWVRDGVYATVALARSGHLREAKKSLNFFLNAQPVGKYKSYVGGVDYRVSLTRYFGNGEEEADYSGTSSPNIETDGWGLVLWAAREYLDASGDTAWLSESTRDGKVYDVLLRGIARPIESQLETGRHGRIMKPDSGIWEYHQDNAKHFAFTNIAAARGLCDFASIAKRHGRKKDHQKYARLSGEVRSSFLKSFVAPEGFLIAALERNHEFDHDAQVAEAFGLDVITDFDSQLAKKTLSHLELLKLPEGGFMRIDGDISYETNEWIFINYRMAGTYLRMGQRANALALIDRMTERATKNFNLLPEMYNRATNEGGLGDYAGSLPMVGYGPGVFVLSLLERAGKFSARNCD